MCVVAGGTRSSIDTNTHAPPFHRGRGGPPTISDGRVPVCVRSVSLHTTYLFLVAVRLAAVAPLFLM